MEYLFPDNSGSNYDDIAIWGLQGKMSTDESAEIKLKFKNNDS